MTLCTALLPTSSIGPFSNCRMTSVSVLLLLLFLPWLSQYHGRNKSVANFGNYIEKWKNKGEKKEM